MPTRAIARQGEKSYTLRILGFFLIGVPFLLALAFSIGEILGVTLFSWCVQVLSDFLRQSEEWFGVEFPTLKRNGDQNLYSLFSAFGTLVTVLVLTVTALWAFAGYRMTRDTQVKSVTLSYISKINEDRDVIQTLARIRFLREKYQDNINYRLVMDDYLHHAAQFTEAQYNERSSEYAPHDFDHIIHLLNFYETWAIGINNGALNEGMLRDWWRETFVNHWRILACFVYDYRLDRAGPEAYEHMEKQALDWAMPHEEVRIKSVLKDRESKRAEREREAQQTDDGADVSSRLFRFPVKKPRRGGAFEKKAFAEA